MVTRMNYDYLDETRLETRVNSAVMKETLFSQQYLCLE